MKDKQQNIEHPQIIKNDNEKLEKAIDAIKEWRRKRFYGMTQILPNLFIGSLRDANDIQQLNTNKITDILSIHNLCGKVKIDESMNQLHIQLADQPGANISDHFHRANSFIHNARTQNRSVLVHCLAGASRSVCLVAAYLITVTDMTYANAIAFITSKRPFANPNFGFRMQLVNFVDKKLSMERIHMENEFDADILRRQREADANAIIQSPLLICRSIPKVRSAQNILHVSPEDRPNSRDQSPDRLFRQDHRIHPCRKSASSDCLITPPGSPRCSKFLHQMNSFRFIDQ